MQQFKRSRTTLAVALSAAALAGAGGATAIGTALGGDDGSPPTAVEPANSASPVASTDNGSVAALYKRAYKGVVEISVTSSEQTTPSGGRGSQQSQGSGFVYDRDGHVITNQHVVAGAQTASVKFWDGKSYDAKVVGSDPSTDVAVLEVDAPASALYPLALGSSSTLEVGEGVVAIGSPFGLEQTVTAGIVSALDRQITAPNNFTIDGAIQTDAAINHGNSGGPLLDLSGKVIGVNSQIESESGGNDGVGFAVSSDTVKRIASQLIEGGSVEHAYLGVATEDLAGSGGGASIAEVRAGTPAAAAGLRGGDVVTKVDGKAVISSDDLRTLIDSKAPGDTVKLTVKRGGETLTLNAKLGTRPSA